MDPQPIIVWMISDFCLGQSDFDEGTYIVSAGKYCLAEDITLVHTHKQLIYLNQMPICHMLEEESIWMM